MSDIPDGNDKRSAILTQIRENLRTTERHIERLRGRNTRFTYTGLIASGVATVISGQAAAFGQLGAGTGGWRITCGIVAVCTASATIITALHKQFTVSENLSRAMLCAGKLNALLIALTVTERDTKEIAKEYEDIVANFREFVF